MQKTKTKIITLLLLTAMTLALFPLVNASTGFITILTTPAQVPAGGDIALDFTQVLWSGGQFYLLLSRDGFSQVSPADIRFTPSMTVSDLRALTPTVVTDPQGTFPGSWTVVDNTIVGSIPSNVAGGEWYIKAFDGAITSLAVTSSTFTILGSLTIVPDTGAGGTSILINGNAFPLASVVNVSYVNPLTLDIVSVADLVPTGDIGEFSIPYAAPDLMLAAAAGDSPVVPTPIEFSAAISPAGAVYTAIYNENPRGLLQIGRPRAGAIAGNLQNATGLYGNLTSFDLTPTAGVATISVGVGQTMRIVGNWFNPGPLSIMWDAVDVTPADLVANGTGYFNTTFTVPMTTIGSHEITIMDDGPTSFVVTVNVVPSIILTPTTGPTGTVVTINGYGFEAPAGTNVYQVTVTWDNPASTRTTALTDAMGSFTSTFTVPGSPTGVHIVTATSNGTATATATFTVVSNFVVTPSSFANNASQLVTATGTGFNPEIGYWVSIDNQFSQFSNNAIFPDATGTISFAFIGDGFRPGTHVVTLYEAAGNNFPAANASFTVTGAGDLATDMLTSMNTTIIGIGSNVTSLGASITTISGDTAFLRTTIGTVQTSLSSVQATLGSIQNSIAQISTPDLGPITTSLSSISARLETVSGDTASIRTTVGSISTSLSSINTVVTRIDGNVATIETDIGSFTGMISSVEDGIATIETAIGTMQADISGLETDITGVSSSVSGLSTGISGLQSSINGVQTGVNAIQADVNSLQTEVTESKTVSESLSPLIIVAIVLALIAAIAAIASIILMRRKIAG